MSRGLRRDLPIVLLAALVAPTWAWPEPAAGPVRLHVLDCGRLRLSDLSGFGLEPEETPVRELAVPCHLIEHPEGRLLWDGGLPSSVAEAEGWSELGPGIEMRLDATLAEQLAPLGLDLGSFDYVAFSHFHFDHVGVANEIEGATLLIQRAEHDAAFAPEPLPGFQPELYEALRGAETRLLDGDHDVFGDGRVRILSTPGHTPGHQSLYVDLGDGAVVISGDLFIFRRSRELERVPAFSFDPAATLESRRRIEALLEETGAELWISHELARFERSVVTGPPSVLDTRLAAYIEVWNTGEVSRLDRLVAPDFRRHAGPDESTDSAAGLKRLIGQTRELFDRLSVTIEDQTTAGDRGALRGRFYGVHRQVGGVVEFPLMGLYRFAEGLIAEEWIVGNNFLTLMSLGYELVPPGFDVIPVADPGPESPPSRAGDR